MKILKRILINKLVFVFNNILKFAQLKIYSEFRTKYNIDKSVKFNGPGIKLYGEGYIEIGKKTYIGEYSFLQSVCGCSIIIGSNCAISHNVKIYTSSYVSDQDFTFEFKKKYNANVHIGDGVWIGVNVLINPGINIGKNSVIAANSVVTKDVPPDTIYGGLPAKFIKNKFV